MKLRRALAAGVVFLCGFLVTAALMRWSHPRQPGTLDTGALKSTTAVVLVVSPRCGACNDPSLPDAWQALLEGLSRRGQEPYRVGIAASSVAQEGVTFLSRFGHFHEVMAGGGWKGVGSRHFISGGLRGPAAVPQVVLLERNFPDRAGGGADPALVAVG